MAAKHAITHLQSLSGFHHNLSICFWEVNHHLGRKSNHHLKPGFIPANKSMRTVVAIMVPNLIDLVINLKFIPKI